MSIIFHPLAETLATVLSVAAAAWLRRLPGTWGGRFQFSLASPSTLPLSLATFGAVKGSPSETI